MFYFSVTVQQVACGAYHSLALVRSLPPQDYNTQNPIKIRERGRSPHCPVTEREELFTAEDSHYCPLGVELTEVMRGEVKTLLMHIVSFKSSDSFLCSKPVKHNSMSTQ